MNELYRNRRERFTKLAEQRTDAVLNKLRLVGNLSNRSNYQYDEIDIRKIFLAIDEQLRTVKAKFQNPHKKKFKL